MFQHTLGQSASHYLSNMFGSHPRRDPLRRPQRQRHKSKRAIGAPCIRQRRRPHHEQILVVVRLPVTVAHAV